jgi:hypothetical protein
VSITSASSSIGFDAVRCSMSRSLTLARISRTAGEAVLLARLHRRDLGLLEIVAEHFECLSSEGICLRPISGIIRPWRG